LFATFREPLRRVVPDDVEYAEVFDSFEYLLAANYFHLSDSDKWAPPGRWCWRRPWLGEPERDKILKDEDREPILGAGFFDASPERLKEIEQRLAALPLALRWHW
jgi:hypothetical protein